jgi:hypothetical protein
VEYIGVWNDLPRKDEERCGGSNPKLAAVRSTALCSGDSAVLRTAANYCHFRNVLLALHIVDKPLVFAP